MRLDLAPHYACPVCGTWASPPDCEHCGQHLGPTPPQSRFLPWVAGILVAVLVLAVVRSPAIVIGCLVGIALLVSYTRRVRRAELAAGRRVIDSARHPSFGPSCRRVAHPMQALFQDGRWQTESVLLRHQRAFVGDRAACGG